MKKLLLFTLCAMCIISCKKDEGVSYDEQMAIDEQIILDYLTANSIPAQKTDEGVYYHHWQEGTGVQATINDDVTVHYTGEFLDGTIFDTSTGNGGSPITFSLDGVIEGWKIGIPLMKEGGRTTLVVPSRLAYGPNNYQGIPGNSVLVFLVELIDVN